MPGRGTAANQNYGVDHRKVIAYRAYADGAATGVRDHGTHVVGSILGESSTPGAEGAGEMGSAYKAKVTTSEEPRTHDVDCLDLLAWLGRVAWTGLEFLSTSLSPAPLPFRQPQPQPFSHNATLTPTVDNL